MNDMKIDEEKYNIAKRRVEEIKGFYAHLFAYLGVNVVLIVINLITSPGTLWFYWVTVFWGIGIFWHAMGVFVFHRIAGVSWEKKKIKQIMDEMDRIDKKEK